MPRAVSETTVDEIAFAGDTCSDIARGSITREAAMVRAFALSDGARGRCGRCFAVSSWALEICAAREAWLDSLPSPVGAHQLSFGEDVPLHGI